MIILGIDPGFGRVGWGVIEKRGAKLIPLAFGCIDTDPKKDFLDRLTDIHDSIKKIINDYKPDVAGVEELYFSRNVTTAIKVAQARGTILLTLHQGGVKIFEYNPLQVKQAVVGYGKAEKAQVQKMVQMILKLKNPVKQDDAADALAVAILTASNN